MNGVQILVVELRWFERGVRQVICIKVEQTSLNKDGGCYNLPSIWNIVLNLLAWGPAPMSNDGDLHQDTADFPEQRLGLLQPQLHLEQCVKVASPGPGPRTEDHSESRLVPGKLLTPSGALPE